MMNKGLEIVANWKAQIHWNNIKANEVFQKELDIIETELKRLEEIEDITKTLKEVIQFNMTQPTIDELENGYTFLQKVAFEQRRSLENKERELFRNWILKECFPNELEILRILKKKLNIGLLHETCNDEHIYQLCWSTGRMYISQAEFDLLKECLK